MSRSSWLNSDWACFDETGCLISLNYPAKLLSSKARNHQKPIWVKRSHGPMSRMSFYDWRLSTAPSDLPGSSYIKPRCWIYGILTHIYPLNYPNVGFWIYYKLEHLFGNVQSKRAWLIHGSFPICCSTQMGDHHSHHSSASGWRCGFIPVVSDVDSALFICWGTKNLYMFMKTRFETCI